ncbi:hypothetical protein IGI04_027785 [Brassica rapa subsp. trilocularis]|uniref:Uncharacterized protein n=1 Tax=Brassica rapa subsp. trilocularis TaxID=1813537 RepID=A0ABQ7L023_BRACM|nr:hypothetical protein IGI04_027785 [Brassica rapa subsp. trilocularis]
MIWAEFCVTDGRKQTYFSIKTKLRSRPHNGSTGQAKKLTIEDLFMRTHALTHRLWRRRRTENIEEDLR